MAYNRLRVEIYNSLIRNGSIEPSVLFYISEDELLECKIDEKQGSADDIFEIYGRKATITAIYAGSLKGWIQSKPISTVYPEYLDAYISILDIDTGIIQFVGAIRYDSISHDYDANTVSMTISDALDIWITQAKKYNYKFGETEANNYWALEDYYNSVHKLLTEPVSQLAYALRSYVSIYSGNTTLSANDIQIDINGYNNDFSQWQNPYPTSPWSWKAHYSHIQATSENKLLLTLLFIVRYGAINSPSDWAWQTVSMNISFSPDNMFQPIIWNSTISEPNLTPTTIKTAWKNVFGADNITIDGGTVIINTQQSATLTIGSDSYMLRFADNKAYATFPIRNDKLFFSSGTQTYDRILYAMLTANLLYCYTSDGGYKIITNSTFSNVRTISSGTVIANTAIINQKRSGFVPDINKLTDGVSPLLQAKNLETAIKEIYQERLSTLACRLEFSFPESYYQGLDIFQIINIDSQDYIITSISYPYDGIIDVECVGEWN